VSDYDNIILELKDFSHSLSMGYIDSFSQDEGKKRELILATNIIQTLYNYKYLFLYLSHIDRKDLEDTLRTHEKKYIENFKEAKKPDSEIIDFQQRIANIVEHLNKKSDESPLENQELKLVRDRAHRIIKNAQLLFAEQSNCDQVKISLQALSIAVSCYCLNYNEQNAFYEQLLQVKELWEINDANSANPQSIKYKFHYDTMSRLQLIEYDDAISAFEQTVVLLTGQSSTFDTLSDAQLIHLYDRFKNLEWTYQSTPLLLNRLHEEAQFRYNYNRLSDAGYDLLNRFQSFDTLMHQIDSLEFAVIESYLINSSNFAQDTLELISKRTENIRGLALTKDKNLEAILTKIESKIQHLSGSVQKKHQSKVKSLRLELNESLEATIQKQYVELDKFTELTLQKRYINLFKKIDAIIEEKTGYIESIQELFIKKITKDFYLPNLSNSIDKLRKMGESKLKVSLLLSQLNLADIFLKECSLNKILSLDFKHVTLDSEIKTPIDYVQKLISEIVSMCSAFQLETLYKPLISNKTRTALQNYLKEEIINQIHERTSVGKKMLSLVSGQKKEFDRLETIKRGFAQEESV
jgi:hypothetical protein